MQTLSESQAFVKTNVEFIDKANVGRPKERRVYLRSRTIATYYFFDFHALIRMRTGSPLFYTYLCHRDYITPKETPILRSLPDEMN